MLSILTLLFFTLVFFFKSENGGNDPLTGEDDNRIHGPAPAILRRQSTYWDERVRECLKLKNPFAVVSSTIDTCCI